MTYRIKIQDHMDLFRAAHEALEIEIPEPDSGLTPAECVKSAWHDSYGVDVVYENSQAKYLDFRDEKDYAWFMLSVN